MKQHMTTLGTALLVLAMVGLGPVAVSATSHPGFLVVAPDRGFLGNQETRTTVEEFQRHYPAALAFVGNTYERDDTAYAAYLRDALSQLRAQDATSVVVIPLFLSDANPQLHPVRDRLPAYAADLDIQWAPDMSESYLTGQILLDRIQAISHSPHTERLILVGLGARDENSEQAIQDDLTQLLQYVQRYMSFQDSDIAVYYHRDAEQSHERNEEITTHITGQAAKPGRTLVVPAFIGVKFDHMMAMTSWLQRTFEKLNVVFQPSEIIPHPNLLVWLKKTANQYLHVRPSEIGVVIMPHGSTQPYNDAIERVIAPVIRRYQIEMAYGMGDPTIIQHAVSRLEQRGIRKIVFGRMYGLSDHMKARTDYILGLSDEYLQHRDQGRTPPPQLRSAAVFSTFGGYEEDTDMMASVLHERIMEISQKPEEETVILLAHGTRSDEDNQHWLSVINTNIAKLRQDPHCAQLKDIKAATVREDWPELRKQAVKEVREMIQEGNKTGRVLVISNRLYGPGPYEHMLDGLDFVFNGKGFLSPAIADWVEESIQQTAEQLTAPGIVAAQR